MNKKILTTLIAGGVALAAVSAVADSKSPATPASPSLKITGLYRALIVGTSQKVRTNKGSQVMNHGNFTFNAGGVANNGLSYGLMAVLELDRARKNSDKFTETYAYAGSDAIGDFQFGDTQGVSSIMMYDASDITGAGGFDANLDKQLNITRGVDFNQGIGYVSDGSARAGKITWMSPEVSGYQIGISYVPETSQYGRLPNTGALDSNGKILAGSAPYATNLLEGAASFTTDAGPYTVGLYLVGVTGKAKKPRNAGLASGDLNPVQAWQIGTLVDYESWQFGAGYFNNGKSYMRKYTVDATGKATSTPTNFTNTRGYNVGVAYGMGPVNLALGHTGTERTVTSGKAKADISSFSVDCSVADGLAVYGGISYFNFKSPAAHIYNTTNFVPSVDYLDAQPSSNKNNSGTAVVLGTRITF